MAPNVFSTLNVVLSWGTVEGREGIDGQGGKPDKCSPGVGGDGGGAAVGDQVDLSDVWKATLEELADEISSRQQRAY
ncbi:MAG TPA: hypothetical protein VFG35_19575, partial [Actinoplanes sp.]|nr:hypothetical protein [Actinoplanes sp.]